MLCLHSTGYCNEYEIVIANAVPKKIYIRRQKMKYWQVNRIHPDSIIEEVLRINLETETSEEAVEILNRYGYEVIEIDEEWETIKVVREAK